MDYPSPWREVAAQFSKIRREDQDRLDASWIASVGWNAQGDLWYLSGIDDPRVHEYFRWAAERAAVLLGQKPGPLCLFFWLDLLRRDSPSFQGVKHGGSEDVEGGIIRAVCMASEEYCFKLETEAIAKQTEPAVARVELIFANMKARAKAKALEAYLVEKGIEELRLKDSLSDAANIVDEPSTPSTPLNPLAGAPLETIAEQLRRLRDESRLTIDALTAALRIDSRSVERHLAGTATPRIGHIGAYERAFSAALKRKVVISRTPVKRR